MYSYDDLFLFAKVAEIGSFTKTGKVLKVNHTTISRRMKVLEDQLGIFLISHRGNTFELTDLGREVYECLRTSVFDIEESTAKISNLLANKDSVSGHLRVILPPIFSLYLITPFIPAFLRKYPNIRLDIYYDSEEVDLVKTGIDLAITHIFPSHQSQKVRSIYKTSMGLYCTKSYKDKYGVPGSLEDLANHLFTCVSGDIFEPPSSIAAIHKVTRQTSSIINNGRLRINNAHQSTALMLSGEIISGLFDFNVNALSAHDDIIHVLSEYEFYPFELFLLRHPYINGKVGDIFADFLVKLLK